MLCGKIGKADLLSHRCFIPKFLINQSNQLCNLVGIVGKTYLDLYKGNIKRKRKIPPLYIMLADNGVTEAVEAFRMALMLCPDDAEIHFYLASALYRIGNVGGAMERYHVAVELDHEYIEAWTQLGCLRFETGDSQAAIEAFDIALTCHADYSDAVYHKATVLSELGRNDEAVVLLKQYLDFDQEGPWATSVMERLEAVYAASAESVESVDQITQGEHELSDS